jgi:GT2 family glycosyltransferase/glycosyltransferase involved in cell wall biosynthesis
VVSFETIEHLEDHDGFMKEIKRLLRPGGLLIISSPNRPIYSEKPNHENPFHVREMDLREFRELVGRNFANVKLYAQRQLTGSLLYPNDGASPALQVYSTDDNLTYRVEDPVESPQYFVALASDGSVEVGAGSVLSNEIYVSSLQQENNWNAKQLRLEKEKVAQLSKAAASLEHLTRSVEQSHATALEALKGVEKSTLSLHQRFEVLEKSHRSTTDVLRGLKEKQALLTQRFQINEKSQAKATEELKALSKSIDDARANTMGGLIHALFNEIVFFFRYLFLNLSAFLRYPLSRRKRRAYIDRRLKKAAAEFAKRSKLLSWRIGRFNWRLRAILANPRSSQERRAWRRQHPYRLRPGAPAPIVTGTKAEPVIASSTDQVTDHPLHARLFEAWVKNALGQYEPNEHIAIARHSPPVELCDVKLIAYYLPQFHPIPENNAWWGEGFTEWRNVARAFPNFEGHYQPRIPGELGYYDLRVPEIMRRQVELARLYGISAFCFHFYWFGGKTLLERPIRHFHESKDLDLPFCLCWANENWSRRWDGSEHEVLIAQQHSAEDDEAFFRHVEQYFRNDRYLKVDGKPVLTVYRPSILPDARATTDRWRRLAAELGYPGLYLIATNAFAFKDYEELGFDALSEFPPHHTAADNVQKSFETTSFRTGWRIRLYEEIVEKEVARDPGPGRIHPGIMMAWDNSARRPMAGEIIHGSTPALFSRWLRHCFNRAQRNPDSEQLVFVNAWNEWAEGTYLEPDKRFGYAFLTACADAIREDVIGAVTRPQVVVGRQAVQEGATTVLVCAHNAHDQVFGAERSLLDALRAIAATGRTLVVTLPRQPHPDYMEALLDHVSEVRIFPYAQWTHDTQASVDAVPDFMAAIRDVRADLVYVNTIVLRAPLEAARLTGVPAVVHARELIEADEELQVQIGRSGTEIARFIFRHSAHIVANSAATAASFQAGAPVSSVPNIVDLAEFDLPDPAPGDVVRFALISSNLPKKGVEDAVELARRCELTVPDARFIVIGPLGRPGVREYVSGDRKAPRNIEFVDYLPSSREAISRADVVLNLSHFKESFGRTVLEAMAAGRPVIVYDWGALPELVESGVSGLIVPFRDIDAAANAVAALADRATLARMSVGARERARRISNRESYDAAIAGAISNALELAADCSAEVEDASVGVVVCVHNALEDVRACLDSVDRYWSPKHQLVLVDDGSDVETADFLRSFAADRSYVTLHRNEVAQGYTKAANTGARLAQGEVIILLNSDTVVTQGWAEKLARAVQSAPGIGIAGPLSNAASYQSIPEVRPTPRQTAVNALPDGWSVADMNAFCEGNASPRYPAVPLIHGFCFAMTREVWDSVGPFDEDAFPRGFGEENDFCFRAADAGFGMVVATDTYVFHAKSKSYGEDTRHTLVMASQQILYDRHGRKRFMDSVKMLDRNPELRRIRGAVRSLHGSGIAAYPGLDHHVPGQASDGAEASRGTDASAPDIAV